MGGTSVWFTCLAIGIIISVSRSLETEEQPEKVDGAKLRTTVA